MRARDVKMYISTSCFNRMTHFNMFCSTINSFVCPTAGSMKSLMDGIGNRLNEKEVMIHSQQSKLSEKERMILNQKSEIERLEKKSEMLEYKVSVHGIIMRLFTILFWVIGLKCHFVFLFFRLKSSKRRPTYTSKTKGHWSRNWRLGNRSSTRRL